MRINHVEIIDLTDENRELQEMTMASHLPKTRKKRTIVDLDAYDVHDEVRLLYSSPSCKKTRVEIGESSNSPSTAVMFICEIYMETKLYSESFAIMGCTHSYCSDCVTKYVSSKLDQNITQVCCPITDCNKGVLDPEHCRAILPPEVFDKWGSALRESAFVASKKFYCPYKDCSAFMIDDDDGDGEGEAIAQGIDCSEFQKLHEDEREREDIMLMNLAKKKKWPRCPQCKAYIQKNGGCNIILVYLCTTILVDANLACGCGYSEDSFVNLSLKFCFLNYEVCKSVIEDKH
ncbi:uncharacterized protein LOC131323750 [Rhododendron vialii]|uniref:uncharacterized protein LOC131323750 n=1 Tax=Rhododendron vialii TaxID=182163 RepID=UPI00266026CA|nr:uncharacterized protein LOC131323750 [Rhododendron vialii]